MQTLEQKLDRPQQVWCSKCKNWKHFDRALPKLVCECGEVFIKKTHPLILPNEKAVKKVPSES